MDSISQVGSAASSKLVELITGEYTAASVAANEQAAVRLALVKYKDGNYGVAPTNAAAQSSPATLDAVSGLQVGGL